MNDSWLKILRGFCKWDCKKLNIILSYLIEEQIIFYGWILLVASYTYTGGLCVIKSVSENMVLAFNGWIKMCENNKG